MQMVLQYLSPFFGMKGSYLRITKKSFLASLEYVYRIPVLAAFEQSVDIMKHQEKERLIHQYVFGLDVPLFNDDEDLDSAFMHQP